MAMPKAPAGPETDETLKLDIDDLFKDEDESQESDETSKTQEDLKDGDMTKRMSERINEVRAKTEKETRDKIAQEAGYKDYAEMQSKKQEKLVEKHGLNPEDLAKVINELGYVKADDPRLTRLAALEAEQRNAYIQRELAEINKITKQQYTSAEQLPKDVIQLWGKGVDLSEAFFAKAGKTIITKGAAALENGSLSHMAPAGQNKGTSTRGLTDFEKDMWRAIVPGITDKELSEKTIELKKETK